MREWEVREEPGRTASSGEGRRTQSPEALAEELQRELERRTQASRDAAEHALELLGEAERAVRDTMAQAASDRRELGVEISKLAAATSETRPAALEVEESPRLRGIDQAPGATRALGDPARGESVGLLIGSRGDRGRIKILDTLGAPRGSNSNGSDEGIWSVLIGLADAELAAGGGAAEVVGWYRTRPGGGVELGPDDARIYAEYFPGWWQVALLVDPLEREHVLYGRIDGRIRALGAKRQPRVKPAAGEERVTREQPVARPAAVSAPARAGVERRVRDGAGVSDARREDDRDQTLEPRASVWGIPVALFVPLLAGIFAGAILVLLV